MEKRISPKAIYDIVDTKVVGQHAAKKAVATSLFLHLVRFFQREINDDEVTKKSNLLLMGPSGVGKTYIVREAVKAVRLLLDLDTPCPLLEVDATELSAPGWKGDDLSTLIAEHAKDHSKNPSALATSVVFIDEFDKLALPGVGNGGTDHNRNTQYNLLKMMEGSTVRTEGNQFHAPKEFSTDTFLFILAGNFAEIRSKRKANEKPAMGFISESLGDTDIDMINELDNAGVATQILGRISHVAELEQLNEKQLLEVLEEHLIPEYKSTWDFLGQTMRITKPLKKKIVNKALERGTGARGLQADLAAYAEDKLFNVELDLIATIQGD